MADIFMTDDTGRETEQRIAYTQPAAAKDVEFVLSRPETDDGRSAWTWIRLQNGDLILGVYPCGETYFEIETNAP